MASGNWNCRRRLVLEPLEKRYLLATSSLVWSGIDGHLIYRPDAEADRVADFADVGYKAGREDIPDVPTVVTVSAGVGDDTARIQAAINQVAAMPLDANGFRGAVLLETGHYDIDTRITISASGIVLRGEGRGVDDTVLHARGDDRRPLISIDGSGSMQLLGSAKSITDFVVPVGARTFQVSDTSGLGVGDSILITRPTTAEWIHDIGMDQLDEPWQPGARNLKFERVITRIDGSAITIDVPLSNSFEQRYGGGTVQEFSFSGRIRNVGVENLRAESDFDSDTDEEHAWDFVSIYRTEDAWVRQTTAQYFAYAHVKIGDTAKWVTVSDAINLDPKSLITGGRRYAFTIFGQQNLVTGCESRDGRHDYVLHASVAGPNVFHDSVAINANNDTGPHHRWSTGALFDNIVSDGELNAENRWNWGTGHGWAGANMVFYNCTADGYRVQNPLTAQNWVIGSVGEQRDGRFAYTLGALPGTYDSHGTPVTPDSLYEAQLAERTAHDDLDYREYWLGDIDGFTANDDSSVDDVYVDPDWLAALPGNTSSFDDLQNDRWVPFSFDVGLAASDQLVGATLALGMQNTGGSSSDDRIYLESTSQSLLFSDLGWAVSNTEEDGYVLDLGGHLDLLEDGLLNLAVAGDTAIDWAVLNLQVVTGKQLTYVDDSFTGNPGDAIADADLGTSGDQPAVFGVDAFSTVAEAVAATAGTGTIILNGGTYAEAVSLAGTQTLHVTGPDVAQTVTVNSLAGSAGTALYLQGSVVFAGAGTSSIGQLNVRSNRAEPVAITIPAGHALTVTGDVSVGVPDTTGATTNLTVTGDGDLNISNPSATVDIGLANSSQSSPENQATVDLTGLSSFTADVNGFRVGFGSRIRSTLLLSNTANTVTANLLTVSDSGGNNAKPGIVTLGSGANTLQVNAIEAGLGKGNGTIAFASQAAGSPGIVTIRGRAGGASAADITLACDDVVATGVTPVGTLDLRGHTADVVAETLTIARRTIGGSGGVNGTLSFDAGTFSVDAIDMATKSGGDNTSWATLNIDGGDFTVNAGGTFQLANQTGGGAAKGKLNITGGSLTSNVDITDGGGTSTTTIKLDGGTLDLTGHNIGGATPINVLNLQSGALQNVGQINSGAIGLTKTTGGTLIVAGANTYTAVTTVEDGILQVDGSITSNVTVNANGTLHGSGVVTGNVFGTGAFSPGNSPGRMTINGDFTPTGTVSFEVNSPFAAGTDHDQYVTSGSVDLSGASLTITTNTPDILVLPTPVTLIANDSGGSTVASSNPAEGSEVVVGSATGKIFYNAGDGNDVVLANAVTIHSDVVARHIFYNNSYFDDNDPAAGASDDAAIAIDKTALLPGDPAATFANYTSYSRGINGIMVDIQGLADPVAVEDTDYGEFAFTCGNDDDAPGDWLPAPDPADVDVRDLGGGVSRVTIVWADNAIQKEWLQVAVLATAQTGLAQPDVFFFGNAVGESGNDPPNAKVNLADFAAARDNPHSTRDRAAIDDNCDYNRDSLVNAVDMAIARDHGTSSRTALKLIDLTSFVAYTANASTTWNAAELINLDDVFAPDSVRPHLSASPAPASITPPPLPEPVAYTGHLDPVTPLMVTGTTPELSGNVAPFSSFDVTFSKPIDPDGFTGGDVGILDLGAFAGPNELVRLGGGVSRVTIVGADNAIPDRNWLQATVKQHAATGLAADDVSYFGNCIGEATGDGKVLISDMYAAYLQLSAEPLDLITPPALPAAAVDAALSDWSDPRFLGSWLYGFLEDPDESEDDEPLMARSAALDYAMPDEI